MIFARHLQRNQLLLEYVDCMCVCLSPPTFSLDPWQYKWISALCCHSHRCWGKCEPPCQSPVEALAYIRSHLGKLMSLPPSKCKFYKQGSNGVRALFKMLNLFDEWDALGSLKGGSYHYNPFLAAAPQKRTFSYKLALTSHLYSEVWSSPLLPLVQKGQDRDRKRKQKSKLKPHTTQVQERLARMWIFLQADLWLFS